MEKKESSTSSTRRKKAPSPSWKRSSFWGWSQNMCLIKNSSYLFMYLFISIYIITYIRLYIYIYIHVYLVYGCKLNYSKFLVTDLIKLTYYINK